MRSQPGYRSNTRTLKRLSATAAYLDLSGGACPRFDSSALARAVTRGVNAGREGSREAYAQDCSHRVACALEVDGLAGWSKDERQSLARMAPALSRIEDLAAWPARDKRSLVRIVRAKAERSEARAAAAMLTHPRLASALRRLGNSGVG